MAFDTLYVKMDKETVKDDAPIPEKAAEPQTGGSDFSNPELKLSKRQQKILGVKITREKTESEKKRIAEATDRLKRYNEKRKRERLEAEASKKAELGKRARVKIVEKVKVSKPKRKRVESDSEESETDDSEIAYRAKKASRAARAIAKLDEKMTRVASHAPINPYTAAFMRMH